MLYVRGGKKPQKIKHRKKVTHKLSYHPAITINILIWVPLQDLLHAFSSLQKWYTIYTDCFIESLFEQLFIRIFIHLCTSLFLDFYLKSIHMLDTELAPDILV